MSPNDMQTASAEQLRHVLSAGHILLVDHEPAMCDHVSGVLKRYGATAIEYARSADEALDNLGYTSRPYDLVMLRAGLPDGGAHHVLHILVRQRARLRVTLHGGADLNRLENPQTYCGVARCIEAGGLPAILRGVAMVLASQATVARIFASSTVPDVMSVDWAEAIYGALPQRPTPRKLQP